MPNKVRFGLKNTHFAPVTFASDGTPTFGTPVAIPGTVSLSLTKNGDIVEFYADDDVYFEVADNGGYDGDLELALITDAFRTGVLGETADGKGVLFEAVQAILAHFALLFEFAGDVNAVRHVLYNCTAQVDEISGKTREKNIDVQTEKLKIKARPLPGSGYVKAKTGDSADSTTYSNWYSSVHTFTAATQQSG